MQVTIAGSGGWGTALAILLHENGHDVTLWSHFETESKQLAETHQNPYLPGVTLPEGLHYSADPACAQIVPVMNGRALRSVIRASASLYRPLRHSSRYSGMSCAMGQPPRQGAE